MHKRLLAIATAMTAMAAAAMPAAADTWNGAYVGAHTGAGFGDVDQPWGTVGGPFVNTNQDAPDVDGWIYGLQGGFNWSGVVMDTNPPDTDHWWYRVAEEETPALASLNFRSWPRARIRHLARKQPHEAHQGA